MVASVLGAARLRRLVPRVSVGLDRAVVVVVIVSGAAARPSPRVAPRPGGAELGAREHVVGRHAAASARIVALVPAGAVVSATNTLGAHLSARRRVLSFPVRRDATWVVVDTRRPSHLDRANAPEPFEQALPALRRDGRFVLVASDDGVLAFRRR